MQPLSDEPRTFTLFPKLPPELQEAIWAHTIDWEPHVLPRPPIPELLVCQQAREVLLKTYGLCFHAYPNEQRNDFHFSGRDGRDPGGPFLTIRGMGTPFPRSPYANYSTDILHLTRSFMRLAHREGSCRPFLSQEAIDNIQSLVIWHKDWPNRSGALPPRPPPVDTKLVITHFGALKVFYLAEESKLQVNFSPDGDLSLDDMVTRFLERDAVDEVMAPGLKLVYAEKKILIPQSAFDQGPHASHKMNLIRSWMERQSTAFPGWKVPDLQFAKLIPDSSSS